MKPSRILSLLLGNRDSKDIQKLHTAQILAILLLADMLILTGIGYAAWQLRPDPTRDLVAVAGVFALQLLVLLIGRLQGLKPASLIFIWGHWLLFIALQIFSTTYRPFWQYGQILLVVVAGLLGSFRLTIFVAGLSVFSNLIFYVAGSSNLAAAQQMPPDALLHWVTHSTVLLLTLVLIEIYNLSHRETSQALQGDEHRFRSLFDKTSDAVILIGLDHHLIAANRSASILLGYSEVEMVAQPLDKLIAPEERREALARIEIVEKAEILPSVQRTFLKKNGERVILEVNLSLVRDSKGEPLHYQSIARNITDRVQENERLKSTVADLAVRARTDALTGILNRIGIIENLEAEWSRAQREDSKLSLMLLDIDNLKQINDLFGHASGDAALQRFASTLENNKRKYDHVGRYGGDEFLMVLPGTGNAEAKIIGERVILAIRSIEANGSQGWKLGLRASVGIASRVPGGRSDESLEEFIKRTDEALYMAKHAGRDRVEVAV